MRQRIARHLTMVMSELFTLKRYIIKNIVIVVKNCILMKVKEMDEVINEDSSIDKGCPKHSGLSNEGNRKPYDSIMQELDNNQSGIGRHKCPYCAYNKGRQDMKQQIIEYLRNLKSDAFDFSTLP